MIEQEMNRQRIYDLLNAETKPKFFFCLPYTKQRKKFFFFFFFFFFFYRKRAFYVKGGKVEHWAKNEKKVF